MSPALFIITESMDNLALAVEEEERMDMEFHNLVSQVRPDYRDLEVTPREISSLQGYEQKTKKSVTKQQAFLNVLILGAISMAAGWLGILLNSWTGDAKLALLAFLAVPPLGILALNVFFPDRKMDLGLELQFKKNRLVYLFVFLIVPLFTLLVLLIGRISGFITLTGLIEKGLGAYLSLVVISFFSNFIKNCLEEFTWRGFFSRQFEAAGVPAMLNHLLTGMIWVIWQIPYWLFLLDPIASAQPSPTSILMVCLSLLASSLVYGEVRLFSGSTWPAVFLRASLDAVTIPLLLHGFVTVQPSAAIWLSPESSSITFILLLFFTGFFMHHFRLKKTRTHKTDLSIRLDP